MDSYPFIVAMATVLFLAVVLMIEYAIRRREGNRILLATSVGLDGGIANAADADRGTTATADDPADTGSDAVESRLGKLGGDLNG